MNSFHTKQTGATMIPNFKLKAILLCAAFCVQQGVLAQTAAGTTQVVTPSASPATPATAANPATTPAAPAKKRVPTELADAIVVVVNDDVITKTELAEKLAFFEHSLK